MRIAIAQVYQETNTFSPRPTSMADFECRYVYYGSDVISELSGTQTEVGGILDVLLASDVQVLPLLAAWAMPGGRVEESAFEHISNALLSALRAAQPIDAVVLSLHGAMCAEHIDDADGELLARIRSDIGDGTPLVCALDWHSNLTDQMLTAADTVIGYRTFPHEDLSETGAKAARRALDLLDGKALGQRHVRRLPLMAQAVTSGSNRAPMRDVVAALAALERQEPGTLPSIFLTQPWLDIPDFATTGVLYHPGSKAAVDRFDAIIDELWRRRSELDDDWPDANGAIDAALATGQQPIAISDLGNVVLAGAPGTNTELLAALAAHPDQPKAAATICAPVAFERLMSCGLGDEVEARFETTDGPPLVLRGRLTLKSDASYTLQGPFLAGIEFRPGLRLVLESGAITLVVTRAPESAQDPAFYTSLGIDLSQMQVVVVKSHNTFKPAYRNVVRDVVYADTQGPAAANPARLPYHRLPRPIYPLDHDIALAT